jgi:hypothetical protein
LPPINDTFCPQCNKPLEELSEPSPKTEGITSSRDEPVGLVSFDRVKTGLQLVYVGLILTVLGIGGGTVCAMVLGETHFSKVTWTAVGVVVIATSLDLTASCSAFPSPGTPRQGL